MGAGGFGAGVLFKLKRFDQIKCRDGPRFLLQKFSTSGDRPHTPLAAINDIHSRVASSAYQLEITSCLETVVATLAPPARACSPNFDPGAASTGRPKTSRRCWNKCLACLT